MLNRMILNLTISLFLTDYNDTKSLICLYSNYGTENDPEFKGYHNGNSEPKGFGIHLESTFPSHCLHI